MANKSSVNGLGLADAVGGWLAAMLMQEGCPFCWIVLFGRASFLLQVLWDGMDFGCCKRGGTASGRQFCARC